MNFPGNSPKVILRGKGLKEAELDRPSTFTIDGRDAGPGSFFNFSCLINLEYLHDIKII